MPIEGGDPMWQTRALIGSALLVFATGCVDRSRTATLIGKVGSNNNAVESVKFTSADSLAHYGHPPLANADVAVVVSHADGDQILASTKSGADGSFTLDYPRELPEGATLKVTAPGHAPYKYLLDRTGPGYWEVGIALKKLGS
jgi:hypothetical protein